MSELQLIKPLCAEDCESGGERGKRGKRGRDGGDGATGPTGPTGPTGSGGISPLVALAGVGGSSFTVQQGFTGVSHVNGSGLYNLTLETPPPNFQNNFVVMVQIIGLIGGESSVLFDFPAQILVRTFSSEGNQEDRAFFITVFDANP